MSVVLCLCAGAASAQDEVLWQNGAGGSFQDGANWQGGTAPGPQEYGVFALPDTYTVTSSGTVQVLGLRILNGDVSLSTTGSFALRQLSLGSVGGPRLVLRLTGDVGPYSAQDSLYNVSLRNAELIGGRVLTGGVGQLSMRDGSEAVITEGIGTHGWVTCDSTSTLRVEGGWISANHVKSDGRVIINNGTLSLNSMTQTGGEMHVTDGIIRADGIGVHGGTHTFINSTLDGYSGDDLTGDFTFSGPSARWVAFDLSSGRLVLRDGARATERGVQVGPGGTLDLGPGTSAPSAGLQSGATLRIAAHADFPAAQLFTAALDGGTLEVSVDALHLPTTAPIGAPWGESRLNGAFILQVDHPNALRVGDVIPIMFGSSIAGNFTTVDLPALGGGRQFQVVRTSSAVSVQVIAGGEPCWSADFNGDGDYGTDQDIEAFFACLGGSCCATCGSADFNSDGDTGTDQDIEAFFRILTGGAC